MGLVFTLKFIFGGNKNLSLLIAIGVLVIGTAMMTVLYSFFRYETSFDTWHEDYNSIYRVEAFSTGSDLNYDVSGIT